MRCKWKAPLTPKPIQGLQSTQPKLTGSREENQLKIHKRAKIIASPLGYSNHTSSKLLLGAPQSAHVLFPGLFMSSNIAALFFSVILDKASTTDWGPKPVTSSLVILPNLRATFKPIHVCGGHFRRRLINFKFSVLLHSGNFFHIHQAGR